MIEKIEYDAFGNKVNSTGTLPNNYLYRGEQNDLDLGLSYLRAGYYILVRKDVGIGRRVWAFGSPVLKIGSKDAGDMNRSEALPGFAPRTDFALVGRLSDPHGGCLTVEALPFESEQLTGTKSVGHIEFQQNAIPGRQFHKGVSELIPGERRGVGIAQLSGHLHLARRVLCEKILIDRLRKDVPHVCSGGIWRCVCANLKSSPRLSQPAGDGAKVGVVPGTKQKSGIWADPPRLSPRPNW